MNHVVIVKVLLSRHLLALQKFPLVQTEFKLYFRTVAGYLSDPSSQSANLRDAVFIAWRIAIAS